jgi:hypothetical protein
MNFATYLTSLEPKEPSFLQELHDMSKTADGAEYFDPKAVERAYNQNPMSRETVIHLSPKQFLMLANELKEPNPRKQETVASAIEQGSKLSDLPYLSAVTDMDGNLFIDGHEGRHRMMALASLGVRSVPVILISGESGEGRAYRWGNTDNRPRTLTGQDDRVTISMPKIETF